MDEDGNDDNIVTIIIEHTVVRELTATSTDRETELRLLM